MGIRLGGLALHVFTVDLSLDQSSVGLAASAELTPRQSCTPSSVDSSIDAAAVAVDNDFLRKETLVCFSAVDVQLNRCPLLPGIDA